MKTLIYLFNKIENIEHCYLWQEKFNSWVDKYIYLIETEEDKQTVLQSFAKDKEIKYKLHTIKNNCWFKTLLKNIRKFWYDKQF